METINSVNVPFCNAPFNMEPRLLEELQQEQTVGQLENVNCPLLQQSCGTHRGMCGLQQVGAFDEPLTCQQQQQPWSTVIPLGVLSPEKVKVQLNRQNHLLIIQAKPSTNMLTGNVIGGFTGKKIQRIICLPQNICLQKLQMRLTRRGELVVMAPYLLQLEEENVNLPLRQQIPFQRCNVMSKWTNLPMTGCKVQQRDNMNVWTRIPIECKGRQQFGVRQCGNINKLNRTPMTGCIGEQQFPLHQCGNTWTCTGQQQQQLPFHQCSNVNLWTRIPIGCKGQQFPLFTQCQNDLMNTNILGEEEMANPLILSTMNIAVQEYLTLLKKVFFPNIVTAKLVRNVDCFTLPTTLVQPQQPLQVRVDVKFLDENLQEVKVRIHPTKRVIIVEILKNRTTATTEFNVATKFVHREITVPCWVDLKNIIFRVTPTGVLSIKMPLLTTIGGQLMLDQQMMTGWQSVIPTMEQQTMWPNQGQQWMWPSKTVGQCLWQPVMNKQTVDCQSMRLPISQSRFAWSTKRCPYLWQPQMEQNYQRPMIF